MADTSVLSDVGSIVSAGVGIAGLLGSAIAFLWGRVEWNNAKVKRELAKCQAREHESRERERMIVLASRERRAALTTVIELLWQEVERLAPNALVLKRAKHLLDDMKAADKETNEKDHRRGK